MSNSKLYIDVHAIQTLPPSCVNRDDTGSPKTAKVGGVTRARVSSQAWKRAMRLAFRDSFSAADLGSRTKRIVPLVAEKIMAAGAGISQEAAEKLAVDALEKAGLKIKSVDKGTDALFFLSEGQADALAELAIAKEKDKKKFAAALNDHPSVDIALFGRMVASDPSLNYDAAAQVAHSISTHEVHNEFDYFTAVDDCAPEDNAGAGHLGTVEFNSATLYRYATVNAAELKKNLGNQTAEVIRKFVDAFICSMPTGKQNTFANRTFPDFVYVTLRTDQPTNLSGAFEKPIVSREGYVAPSILALTNYAENLYQTFADVPAKAYVVSSGDSALGKKVSLAALLDELEAAVNEVL